RGGFSANSRSQIIRSSAREKRSRCSMFVFSFWWWSMVVSLSIVRLRRRWCCFGPSAPIDPRSEAGPDLSTSSCSLFSRLALARGTLGLDAVDPLLPGLLGHERKSELLAHHAGKEAADRVWLPPGGLHDGADGGALCS